MASRAQSPVLKMIGKALRPLFALFCACLFPLLLANHAVAEEKFGIEDTFVHPTDVPASVAADLEKNFGNAEKACFAESKTTTKDALEATRVDLGTSMRALLLKPRIPSDPKAAWGCLCGDYTCPMWIYVLEADATHSIWSSVGVSLEVISRKDNGSKRLLLSSGSSGHQSVTLYAWNGEKYLVLREKAVSYGEGNDMDEQAEKELAKFRADAAQ